MTLFLPDPTAAGNLIDRTCDLASAPPPPALFAAMWKQPYLETCCRSALHRLTLCGSAGRPPGLKDGPCLDRLVAMGFAQAREDGRYDITPEGRARHASEIVGIDRAA